jgi:protein O-GlcNAc transferase
MAFNRLARVQCVTWGHPVTTGIPEMDYFVSSRLLETENSENHYTEHLVQLETLPTYYYRPSLQLTGVTRETFGFNDNQHLYLCPQMLFKFHPDFDLILADILRRDPQGVLVLVNAGHAVWAEMLLRRFHQNMPDVVDRIRILDRLKTQHFLALIDNVDVVLDTLHFGGGSSTYDTLALGTPVVTLPGEFMRGRVTYGCYRKMSILDCVAQSPEEYVEKALHLGTDADYRRDMKERLRQASHVLYEDQAAVNALEAFLLWALNADQQ